MTELLASPEWYSAMYGLAAHRWHLALEEKDVDLQATRFERARKEALLLACGCAAKIDPSHDPDQLKALAQLDEMLFPDRNLPIKTEGIRAPATVPRPHRPTRWFRRPEKPDGRPTRPGPASLPERYNVRRTLGDAEPDGAFATFLQRTVEPSALLLLAGIVAACGGRLSDDQAKPWPRDELLKVLTAATADEQAPEPDRLAATAVKRENLDSRARYNLACYYARTASTDRERRQCARSILRAVMLGTHGAEHRALAAWAWKDPALDSAIDRWKDAEEVLGPRPSPAEPAEPAELERIAAIGGYASTLAKLDIHSAEHLLASLDAPGGAERLAREVDIDPSVVSGWHDLLRLLTIQGIGPAQLNLLEAAGVTRREQLEREKPEALHRRLVEANTARRLVHAVPSPETLAKWQRQAAPR